MKKSHTYFDVYSVASKEVGEIQNFSDLFRKPELYIDTDYAHWVFYRSNFEARWSHATGASKNRDSCCCFVIRKLLVWLFLYGSFCMFLFLWYVYGNFDSFDGNFDGNFTGNFSAIFFYFLEDFVILRRKFFNGNFSPDIFRRFFLFFRRFCYFSPDIFLRIFIFFAGNFLPNFLIFRKILFDL